MGKRGHSEYLELKALGEGRFRSDARIMHTKRAAVCSQNSTTVATNHLKCVGWVCPCGTESWSS